MNPADLPIVVSYGGGTNSTALLILLRDRGERPALIMFADTRDEKPGTYAHLDVMQLWCRKNGFPLITVVKNGLPQGVIDGSLYGECVRLGTLPAKVFGASSCSMKWKVEPQRKHQRAWMAANNIPYVRHFVGFDAGESHRATRPSSVKDASDRLSFETTEYPLIEAGWERDECIAAIDKEGLPRPGKSACYHCPSSRKEEVRWLKVKHPDLYAKAIAMEARALAGEGQAPPARVKGLGRHWNWATFDGSDAGTPEPCMVCVDGYPEDLT